MKILSYKYHEYIDRYLEEIENETVKTSKEIKQMTDIVKKN